LVTLSRLRGPAITALQAAIAGLTIWTAPRIGSYLFSETAEIRRAVEHDASVTRVVGAVDDVAMYRVITTQDRGGDIHERHIVTVYGEKGGAIFNVLVTRDRESGRLVGKPIVTLFNN
jgi:hypothetical protein